MNIAGNQGGHREVICATASMTMHAGIAPPPLCNKTTAGHVCCLPAHLHAEGVEKGSCTKHQHTP